MKKIKRQLILLSILFFMAFICCGAVSAVQYADVAVNSIDCAVSSDGATAEFSINIENKGSIAAQNVVLRDKMAGVDVSNSQYSINNGPWQDWNKNYINLGTMATGQTMLVEFKAPVTSNTLINKAELSTTTPEFNRYNNRLSYTTQANYSITSTAGTGGIINPNGNVNVVKGYSQTFTITPDTGYVILDVLVDGTSVGAVSTYTFNNVQSNHTINATFNTPSKAYITEKNGVSVIDTTTNTVTTIIPISGDIFGIAVSSDGSRVYITNISIYNVSVIDTATQTVIATISISGFNLGIAVNPDGSRVYITNYMGNSVSVIETTTNTVITTIPVAVNPYGVVVSPDGSKVYATNCGNNNVSVIDTATNTVTNTIPVGSGPVGVAVSPDGSIVYVGNYSDDTVSVINTLTNTVIATIPVGDAPGGIVFTPDGSIVYVGNYNDDTVSVINTLTNTVIATIPVGDAPVGVDVTPDGSKVYVANQQSDNVSVIDTATNTVTATITAGIGTYPNSFGKFIG